jgi:nitronate monooxygenase
MIRFGKRFRMRVPVVLAPMAGVASESAALSLAVSDAGGLGSVATSQLDPARLVDVAMARLATTDREALVLMNCWLPLDADLERVLLSARGLDRGRVALSTVFGLLSPHRRAAIRHAGFHSWWATVGTVREALAARDAGADVIVLQGAEAGGHRASLLPDLRNSADTDADMALSLWDLLPEVVRACGSLPVVAAGGIGDGAAMARALALGAVAVQCGSAFLRSPEAAIAPLYDAALASLRAPADTVPTRVYSGRLGRAVARSARAAMARAPKPLVGYPAQRNVMRSLGIAPHWAGTEAYRAQPLPAADIVAALWRDCQSHRRTPQ